MTQREMLWLYWAASAVAWLLLTVLAWKLSSSKKSSHHEYMPLRDVVMILSVAAIVRLAFMLYADAQLSDDFWRYILDGRILGWLGQNPYYSAPVEYKLDWGLQVNNPNMVTIYQPTSQWVFAALAIVELNAQSINMPVHLLGDSPVFRCGFILFDLWIITLLLCKLVRDKRSPWWAILYAWHPLVVTEVAWSGHQDVIGIALLLMALTLLDLIRPAAGEADSQPQFFSFSRVSFGAPLLAGGAFALAIGVKPLILPLGLPILWSLRRQPRLIFVWITTCMLTLVALYLPFALMSGGLEGMFETILIFMRKWTFNGSAHAIISFIVGQKIYADQIMAVLLIAILLMTTVVRVDLWSVAQIYLFAGVLLSSTAHPWYLLWAIALVPIRFDAAIWALSLTIGWSYVALLSKDYSLPLGLRLVEYVPAYALIAISLWRRRSEKLINLGGGSLPV